MNARHTKRLKREKHQVISRIEELRRESIESQKQFERFNQSIELVLLEMRRLETAIPSSNPTQRSALVMSLGEHVLRLSTLRQEARVFEERARNELPKNRAEMVQLEVEVEEANIEEASTLLANARELTRKAAELLQIGAPTS